MFESGCFADCQGWSTPIGVGSLFATMVANACPPGPIGPCTCPRTSGPVSTVVHGFVKIVLRDKFDKLHLDQ